MSLLKVGTENASPIQIYFEDHGSGRPIILIHGWPLNSNSWEKQIPTFLDAGFRVITYDRRGFGRSSHPLAGFDASTLASDLDQLINFLHLQDVILVGFSMGGVEVARYLGKYGSQRVSTAVFISAVTPYLLKSSVNVDGIDASAFNDIRKNLKDDRPKFLKSFFKIFFNIGLFKSMSEEALHWHWLNGISASPIATLKTIDAWLEDYRADLKTVEIPVLVIHGESDKTVPIEASGERMKIYSPHCEFRAIMDAPHGLIWTHASEVNNMLMNFFEKPFAQRSSIAKNLAEQNPELH